MFDVVGFTGMLQWIEVASLHSCAIVRHMELKECAQERTIAEVKEELVQLRESHAGEVSLLEERVKDAKDKYLAEQRK